MPESDIVGNIIQRQFRILWQRLDLDREVMFLRIVVYSAIFPTVGRIFIRPLEPDTIY